MQAAALGDGRLVVVQAILATTIVFALPLGVLAPAAGGRDQLDLQPGGERRPRADAVRRAGPPVDGRADRAVLALLAMFGGVAALAFGRRLPSSAGG